MRVIALIDDPGVIRRILEHLGLWAPEASERGPARARESAGLNFLSLRGDRAVACRGGRADGSAQSTGVAAM